MVASAPLLARLFGVPALGAAITWLALVALFRGLEHMDIRRYERDLRFAQPFGKLDLQQPRLGFDETLLTVLRGLIGLGLILTLGVSCCMLAALVVLPAVLRIQSGRRVRAALIEMERTRRAA